MKNMARMTLTVAILLLVGCSSGKREASNTEANDTNIPSTQTMNTKQTAWSISDASLAFREVVSGSGYDGKIVAKGDSGIVELVARFTYSGGHVPPF